MTPTTSRPRLATSLLFRLLLLAAALTLSSSALAQTVNINEADEEELEELSGIGPKLAAAIVKDRKENGPFIVPEDLARVPGVSSRLVEKLIDQITTGGGGGSRGALVVKEGEPISSAVVDRIMASFDNEPSIRETQEAAIHYARVNPAANDWMIWRVRTNAALPEVRTYVIGDLDRDVRTRTNLDAQDAVIETTDNDNSVRLALQATWDLNRLVFDPVEIRTWRETMRMTNLRDRIVDEVTRRYYERRRLQVDLALSPPTEVADRVRKDLRVQELTADLDALTGGWFSEELPQQRGRLR